MQYYKIILIFVVVSFTSLSAAPPVSRWSAAGGLGLTISPTTLLLSPQLEYHYSRNLYFGPLLQMGIGDVTLFTASASVRYTVGSHQRFRPFVGGGLGLAVGSSSIGNGGDSFGVHIMGSLGADYRIDSKLSIGTDIRINLAPPLKTFFLSWPLVVARLKL